MKDLKDLEERELLLLYVSLYYNNSKSIIATITMVTIEEEFKKRKIGFSLAGVPKDIALRIIEERCPIVPAPAMDSSWGGAR